MLAGRDATQEFYNLHRQDDLEKYKPLLRVGVLEGTAPGTSGSGESLDLRRTVPYAEPTWLTEGFYSPYYSEVSLGSLCIVLEGSSHCPESQKISTGSPEIRRKGRLS